MNCMERREDLSHRANYFFKNKVSECPKCGSRKDIEKVEGNEIVLEYCGWCNSQWKITITTQELKEEPTIKEV